MRYIGYCGYSAPLALAAVSPRREASLTTMGRDSGKGTAPCIASTATRAWWRDAKVTKPHRALEFLRTETF